MSSTYPEDEFDNPGPDAPVGGHRKPPSRWRPVIPFLVILVVVPLLAWGFTTWLKSSGISDKEQSAKQSSTVQSTPQSETLTPTPDETLESVIETPTESATPEESETPEAEATVNYDTAVAVLNASGIQGYAAEVQGTISGSGFTQVSAGNTSGWATAVNTVYYASPDDLATAQQVAAAAGIETVVEDAQAAVDAPVVVLLVG